MQERKKQTAKVWYLEFRDFFKYGTAGATFENLLAIKLKTLNLKKACEALFESAKRPNKEFNKIYGIEEK